MRAEATALDGASTLRFSHPGGTAAPGTTPAWDKPPSGGCSSHPTIPTTCLRPPFSV